MSAQEVIEPALQWPAADRADVEREWIAELQTCRNRATR